MPIAASRHSTKADALLRLGAAQVIPPEETDLVAEVGRITPGKGARIVFDLAGGPYIDKLAHATAEEGIKSLSIRGWVASTIWGKPELSRATAT